MNTPPNTSHLPKLMGLHRFHTAYNLPAPTVADVTEWWNPEAQAKKIAATIANHNAR